MTSGAQPDPDQSAERSPVDALAEEYLARIRNGERPRISEYAQAHPRFADEIHDVFRTLAMLENFAPDHAERSTVSNSTSPDIPKRLGDYRVLNELGRGGMGVVYEAEHETMRRRVALKVLLPAASKAGNSLQRFLREARSAGQLHHTNIVPVFEVGIDNDVHFYAMQFIRGQNLDLVIGDLRKLQRANINETQELTQDFNQSAAQCLHTGHFVTQEQTAGESLTATTDHFHEDRPTGRTPNNNLESSSDLSNVGDSGENYYHRVARIGLQVAEALSYAHEHGILHRDIKPANLILDTEGIVWVTDFGLAHTEGDDLTHTGDVVGTLRYMAPERFRGKADARSDMYSLGLTLYELCTLQYAFDRSDRAELIRQVTMEDPLPPRRVNPQIPKDLETIILKCIAREPSARYRKAAAITQDIRLFLSDRPVMARRATFIEQGWRWCRRNPSLATLMLCVISLMAVILFGTLDFAWRTRELNDQLVVRERQAEQARSAEKQAYAESRYNLYLSLFSQAQAERRNELTGRQDHCLKAISEAVSLLDELNLKNEDVREQKRLLRNETIALLSRTGLVEIDSMAPKGLATRSAVYNFDYDRYAVSKGRIEIRSVKDHSLMFEIPQHELRATDLVFSEDSRYLGTIHRRNPTDPRYVRVWDIQEGQALVNEETPVSEICFSPSPGKSQPPHLAFISSNTEITVFPFSSSESARTQEFDFRIRDIVFLSTNEIAVVGDQPQLAIWSIDANSTEVIPIELRARTLDWSSETNRLVLGNQSGSIDVYHLDGDLTHVCEFKGHSDDVMRLSISPNGAYVLSTAWDGTTRIWEVRTEKELKRIENVNLVTGFSRDNRFFNCIDPTKKVRVFSLSGDAEKRTLRSGQVVDRHHSIDAHPKYSKLVAVATGFNVELWDLDQDKLFQTVRTERTFLARFSEDGSKLLTSGRRGLRIWDVASELSETGDFVSTQFHNYTNHDTYNADASADLGRVIFVDVDGQASLLQTGSESLRIDLPQEDVYRVAMSPNGNLAATIPLSGRGCTVWEASTGKKIKELKINSAVTVPCFSHNGKWLAISNADGRFLWDVRTWKIVREQLRPSLSFGAIAFSPDDQSLLVPRDRFSLELLDSDSFESVMVLDSAERQMATAGRFSSDGTRLMISSSVHAEAWHLPEVRRVLDRLDLDW